MAFKQFPPMQYMTLLASGTLSGTSVSLTSIPNYYKDLRLIVRAMTVDTNNRGMQMQFNSDTGANYGVPSAISGTAQSPNSNQMDINLALGTAAGAGLIDVLIPDYANTSTWKYLLTAYVNRNQTTSTSADYATGLLRLWFSTSAISSITMLNNGNNFSSGNYYLYGIQ